MRISDWSSDVCSSDLPGSNAPGSNAPGSSAAAPGDRQSQRWKGRLTPMATETFSERAAELANPAQPLADEVASLAVEARWDASRVGKRGGSKCRSQCVADP